MAQKQKNDPFGSIQISQESELPPEVDTTQITPSTSAPTAPDQKRPFSRKAVLPKKKKLGFISITKALTISTIFCLGLYFLGGYYLFPALIKTYGATKLSELCGREVTFGRASFNPLNFRLELDNSVVGPVINNPADTVDPFITFSRLTLVIDPRSIFYKGIICEEFRLQQLFVHITKDTDGSTNISALWDQISASLAEQDKTTLDSIVFSPAVKYLKNNYSLNNISVKDAEIVFADATTSKKHHVTNLQITLPTLATIDYQSPRLQPHFSAMINGRPVSLADTQNQNPDSSVIQLALHMGKIDVMPYASYFPADFGSRIRGGLADIKMHLSYDPHSKNAKEQFKVSGELDISGAIFNETPEEVTVDSILLEGSFFPLSQNFSITKLIFRRPIFTLTSSAQNAFTFPFPFNQIENALLAPENTKQLPQFAISNGSITFTNRVTKDTAQRWDNIEVLASVLNTVNGNRQTSSFSISAEKDPKTTVNAQWVVSSEQLSKGLFEANDLDVNDLPTLPGWFTGSLISKGTIEQIKSGFSYDPKPGKKIFTLENMQIWARDIRITDNKTALASLGGWQSENGFFNSTSSLLQFGAVSIKKAQFYLHPPSDKKAWQNLITAPQIYWKDTATAHVSLSSLEVSDSTIVINDMSQTSKGHTLDNFNLSVPQIIKGSQNQFVARATSNNTPTEVSGTFSSKPFSANGTIKAENLPADLLSTVFVPDQQFNSRGAVSLEGSFLLPNPIFTGSLDITDLSSSSPSYSFNAQQVSTAGITIKAEPLALSLDQITFKKPHLSYTPGPKSAPLLSIFTAQQDAKSENNFLNFDSLYLKDGTVSLNNALSDPPSRTLIENVNGSFSRLSDTKENSFSLEGLLDSVAPISLTGTTLLSAPSKTLQTAYQITGYPAPQKNSLLTPVIGHTIKQGRFDLTGKIHLSQEVIQHSLDIKISGLQLGPSIEPGLITIKGNTWKDTPFLQALLQDKEDGMTLPFSTTAKPNSNYSLGDDLINEFQKLLLKAHVSPFSLLDSQNQSGLISPSLFFNFGAQNISPAYQELLNQWVAILNSRPLLEITVTGHSDSHSDRKALIDEKIAEIDKRQRRHEAKLSQALSTSYGKEVIDQPFSSDYAAKKAVYDDEKKKLIVSDKDLLELAQQRIDEVIAYFRSKGVAENQFKAGKAQIIDSLNMGRDGNRTDFTLGLRQK
nr:DUF748 domain-containing protein [Desulfobulbaceae bacterium]